MTLPAGMDVAVDPGSHTAYVINVGDNNPVSVIDASTRTVTATVPLGNNSVGVPVGVAVDPSTHTVYVINEGENHQGTVSVIDGSRRTVTATVPLGANPGVVAVDPSTHTAYVTTEGNSVSVIESR